jgi:hypothetical protein
MALSGIAGADTVSEQNSNSPSCWCEKCSKNIPCTTEVDTPVASSEDRPASGAPKKSETATNQ